MKKVKKKVIRKKRNDSNSNSTEIKKAGDYETGYGKPPKATQFKKGQSGNPKGRPKGSKNLNTLIRKELDVKITLNEGRSSVQATKLEAFVKRLVNDAIQGKPHSMRMLTSIMGTDPEIEPKDLVVDKDHEIFSRAMKRLFNPELGEES